MIAAPGIFSSGPTHVAVRVEICPNLLPNNQCGCQKDGLGQPLLPHVTINFSLLPEAEFGSDLNAWITECQTRAMDHHKRLSDFLAQHPLPAPPAAPASPPASPVLPSTPTT